MTPWYYYFVFYAEAPQVYVVVSFRSDGTNVDTQAWRSGEIKPNVNMSGV